MDGLRNWLRILAPFGMVSAICYGAMVLWAQALWPAYNPISSFVSFLTANGAPNDRTMQTINNVHGLCLLLFALGTVKRATRQYHRLTALGYNILFAASVLTLVGFAVCPVNLNQPFSSVRNMTHFIMTIVIVSTTIVAALLQGIGYIRHEGRKTLGRMVLFGDGLICLFSVATLVCMVFLPGILGLMQRLMLLSLEGFVFFLSFHHTFDRG